MAITLPLGIRLAAGLLGTAVDRVTALPSELPSLAVTFAGQALRTAMRVRQEVVDLAIRGDELLAPLTNRAQEHPEWATFDEDEDDEDGADDASDRSVFVPPPAAGPDGGGVAAGGFSAGDGSAGHLLDAAPDLDVPRPGTAAPGETVLTATGFVVGATAAPAALLGGPLGAVVGEVTPPDAPVNPVANSRRTTARPRSRNTINSDHRLTIAELKERTQQMSVAEVRALLAQEEAGPNRAAYLTLLGNRLMTLQHEDR